MVRAALAAVPDAAAPRRLADVLAPVAICALLEFVDLGLPERVDSALTDFATFGACWILGMAHQAGVTAEVAELS